MSKDLAASVRARLLAIAKTQGLDFNQVLVRFALERMLYRLSKSRHGDRFLLKGALLFTVWYHMPHRSTRDADLLGFGASDLASVTQTFREIAGFDAEDGMSFDPASVVAEEIRRDAGYAGIRVLINGEIAKARCKTQIDIGYGDAVTPGAADAVYPVLLDDLPAPRLRTYPVYTVVSEKLHAIAVFGMTNTRLKDYLDLSVLLDREMLDVDILASAIVATFRRRSTAIPNSLPLGLTDEFSTDASRQALWHAFLKKNELAQRALPDLVVALRDALETPLLRAISLAALADETTAAKPPL